MYVRMYVYAFYVFFQSVVTFFTAIIKIGKVQKLLEKLNEKLKQFLINHNLFL
jgi:hypothetical protein